MKNIQIELPGRTYRYLVKIGSDIIKEYLSEVLANYTEHTAFLVTNETIHSLYPELTNNLLPDGIRSEMLVLPDGEQFKDLEHIEWIYDFLVEKKANRKSIMIAIGGGVVGDMAGFAAATFMRGMPVIQVPTTLLSQVDSGIGGKTGINHRSGKNLIGAFKQPLQTLIDVNFLQTLPERELIAGYAELIKHGFIKDAYLFQILRHQTIQDLTRNRDLLIEAIFRSCEVKARVVEADEKENDQRAVLNFGHTLGHFLETVTGYQTFLHGEAVIIGMDFATWWSFKNEYLDEREYAIVHEHLCSIGVRHTIEKVEPDRFKEIIEHDKKFASKGIRFIALSDIGMAMIVEDVTSENLWETFLSYLRADSLLSMDKS